MNENLTNDRDKDQAGDTKQSDLTRAQPRSALFGLLLIATLALAVGGLYLAYRNQDTGLSTRATVEGLLGSGEMLSARIKELEIQLDQLHEQQEITSRSVQDLVRELPGGNEDWALREVEFLLIIATHHLELERNIDAALGAMQAADLRLRGLDGTALEQVREQLTGDIKRLQELNTVDIRGQARFLGDLANRVNSLPLAGVDKGTGKNAEVLQAPPGEHKGILDALWQELRNLVVIRHEEEKQRALLAPNQEYFVYQNLRLELESARLSLLRRDTENLHASVASLHTFLTEYFDMNDPAVVKVMASLQQLSSINLDPTVPDISSSLESLRAYMREKAEVSPQGAEDGGPQT
jgi:uroporphyrin-3 C-methyltransferase